MVKTTGSKIFVGDIIKLTVNQTVPCDMLLVATSEQLNGKQVCKVDSWFEDGKSLRQVKEAVSLTKSFNHLCFDDRNASGFLTRLNARLDYWVNYRDNTIEGTFKLKSDPRIETFSENMVLRKGSILKTDFIWGLVLYNGNRCLDTNGNPSFANVKVNSIKEKIRSFSLIALAINILFSCFSYLFFLRQKDLLLDQEPQTTFFTFVTLFLSVMPVTFSTTMNIVSVVAALVLQKKYSYFKNTEQFREAHKRSAVYQTNPKDLSLLSNLWNLRSRPISFKVLNPEVIPDLGEIDDAFFDKTDTLTTTEYEVQTIANASSMYVNEQGSFLPESIIEDADVESEDGRDKPVMIDDIRLNADYGEHSIMKNKFVRSGIMIESKDPLPTTPSRPDQRPETEDLLMRSRRRGKQATDFKRNPTENGSPNLPISFSPEIGMNSSSFKIPMSPNGNYIKRLKNKDSLWRDSLNSKEVNEMLLMFAICQKSTPKQSE